MRLVVDKFEALTDKKLEKDLKLILISDVHSGNLPLMSGKRNIETTLRGIKELKGIDFFAFCGDFLNNALGWNGSPAKNVFERFVKEVAKIAPVLLVRGNHDVFNGNKKTEENYRKLGNLKNVILLDNKQIELLGIKITGFAPRHEAYNLSNHGKKAQKIVKEDFEKEHFLFDKKDFNLVLTHSPYNLTNRVMLESFPELLECVDAVLSGHLHNGLFPSKNFEFITRHFNKTTPKTKWQRFLAKNTDFGIWFSVKTGFMISHCRGAKIISKNESSYPILPSSKEFVEVDLTKDKNRFVQIIGKSVTKYTFLPIMQGRPSVVELKISSKNKKTDIIKK